MNQKLLGGLTALFLVVVFGISVSGSLLQSRSATPLENRDRGKQVYDMYCMGCHGGLGDGNGPASYAFVTKPVSFVNGTFLYGVPGGAQVPTDQGLHETITYGRSDGAMPAFPLLTAAERDAVVGYIKTLRAAGWPDVSAVAVVPSVSNEELTAFIEQVNTLPEEEKISLSNRGIMNILDRARPQTCSSCHTIPAFGYTGATGPNLAGLSSRADYAYVVESIVHPDAQIATGCPNGPCAAGAMPSAYSKNLTPAEIDAIARWLLSPANQ